MSEQEIIEGNRLISKFVGYYQPTEVQDDLFSFEVYSSLEECQKDYPEENISTYHGDDIEDFIFVDVPKYHSSWDWLMIVVEKIINDRSSCCTFSGKDYLPKLSFSMLDDERYPFQGESENSLKEACFQAVVKYIK